MVVAIRSSSFRAIIPIASRCVCMPLPFEWFISASFPCRSSFNLELFINKRLHRPHYRSSDAGKYYPQSVFSLKINPSRELRDKHRICFHRKRMQNSCLRSYCRKCDDRSGCPVKNRTEPYFERSVSDKRKLQKNLQKVQFGEDAKKNGEFFFLIPLISLYLHDSFPKHGRHSSLRLR